MDNISLGDNYKPLDVCFKKATGEVIKRAYSKGERRNSNQTLPRIACQVFEKQIASLSVEDKESLPFRAPIENFSNLSVNLSAANWDYTPILTSSAS